MASTLTRTIWPNIPKAELIAALQAKQAQVARSDEQKESPKLFKVHGTTTIDVRLGARTDNREQAVRPAARRRGGYGNDGLSGTPYRRSCVALVSWQPMQLATRPAAVTWPAGETVA